jgi:CysZ protein
MRGAGYLARGARFVGRHRRLWPWVAAPFALTLMVFVVLVWGAWTYYDDLVGMVLDVPRQGWLGQTLWGVLYALLTLSLALAAYFSFFAIAALIAGPFNESLSESVEELVTGRAPPPFSFRRLLRDFGKTIAHGSRNILLYLFLLGIFFLVSLLMPGIGSLVYLVAATLLAARFTAYDVMDATFARRGWPLREKRRWLRQHRGATFGLGLGVVGFLLIPLAGALAMPLGAVGGTLLFLDRDPGLKAPAPDLAARPLQGPSEHK